MTLLDHVLLQVRSGLSAVDRDRDAAQTFVARYGGSPALDGYLADLDRERAEHVALLQEVHALRRHPALLRTVRSTRMVKASLRTAPARRTGTTR